MDIRDILLFLHGGCCDEAAVALATGLARTHGAAVTGCCLCADPTPSIADCYAIGFEGASDVLDRREAKIEAMADPVETAFRAAAAAEGVPADWLLPDPNEPTDELALRARFFDLTIAPRAPAEDHPAGELAEALALRSGGPCVITPAGAPGRQPGRIVLAWNGSAQARRAIDDALPLLARAHAVQLLVVGDNPGWLDHCRPDLMVRRLARHGIAAELEVMVRAAGRDGENIAAACEAFGADLLVMGAYSHGRAREVVLGGATRMALAGLPIPVLMSR